MISRIRIHTSHMLSVTVKSQTLEHFSHIPNLSHRHGRHHQDIWIQAYEARFLRYVQQHCLDPLDEDNNWSLFDAYEHLRVVSTDEDTEEDEGDEGDEDDDESIAEEPTATKRQKLSPTVGHDCELCYVQSPTQISKQCSYCAYCSIPMCSSCECPCPRALRSRLPSAFSLTHDGPIKTTEHTPEKYPAHSTADKLCDVCNRSTAEYIHVKGGNGRCIVCINYVERLYRDSYPVVDQLLEHHECVRCGTINEANTKFCSGCRLKLSSFGAMIK
jgi:hypothetical protein